MKKPVVWRRSILFAALSGVCSCLSIPSTAPRLIGEGRLALFIGNSYLYTMDVPGIVQALADSAGGDKLAVMTVAGADMALIDHWYEGTSRQEMAKRPWEWVVLQQGPSSTEVNRDSLRLVTGMFSQAMTSGQPTLFSAWPSAQRPQDFPRAIESYRLAAADVGGIYAPVAAAWVAAWNRNPALKLYADGLHPSPEGAYLSAVVVYGALLNQSLSDLPDGVRTQSGVRISLAPATAQLLRDAAAEALAAR
ncbi:MAG TPA: hypothetical protein VEB19_14625 [Gemmatimonadaceae bacterium]|nr:hypothetical protein [Gemmatimonadaceae bacterium]